MENYDFFTNGLSEKTLEKIKKNKTLEISSPKKTQNPPMESNLSHINPLLSPEISTFLGGGGA